MKPCLVGPLRVGNRDDGVEANYLQVVSASSIPFSLLCLSDKYVELMITFEMAQFCIGQHPSLEDDQLIVVSRHKLPMDCVSSGIGLQRDPIDEF